MRKLYAILLTVVGVITTMSLSAQVTGITVTNTTPCDGESVTVSWNAGSDGGTPFEVTLGTSAYGSTEEFGPSQFFANTFDFVASEGVTYYATIAGLNGTVTNVPLIVTKVKPTIPTGFTVDGGVDPRACPNTAFDLAATGQTLGSDGVITWYANDEVTLVGPGTDPATVVGGIAVPTDYKVRVEDAVCGFNTAFFTASVSPFVSPSAAATNVALDGVAYAGDVCPGTYELTAVGGNGGDNPATDTVFSTGTPLVLASGASVNITIEYQDGCSINDETSAVIPVDAKTNSTAPALVSDDAAGGPVCSGTNVLFTAVGATEGDGYDYEYQVNGAGAWTSTGTNAFVTLNVTSATQVAFRLVDDCGTTAATSSANITVYTENSDVTAVSHDAGTDNEVCAGDNVTFTADAALLGNEPNARYQYRFTDNGVAGAWIDNGASNTVTLAINNSNSFVEFRVNGDCSGSGAEIASATINIAANNVAPTGLNASAAIICGGQNVSFSPTGATLGGNGAVYEFSDINDFSNILQSSTNSIYTQNVTADVTIYVRINGGCNDVSGVVQSASVDYQEPSVAITSVTADKMTTCGDENVTFTINGGTLGDAGVYEFSDINDFSNILQSGPSNTYSTLVTANTTIYARINGGCNGATAAQSVMVTHAAPSTAITSVNASQATTCGSENVTFTIVGGSLGAGGYYEFASDMGFTNILQSGAMNTYATLVSADITVYARINGGCNGATAPQNVSVDYQEQSVAITSVTASQATTCGTENVTFTINGGTLGDGGVYEFSDLNDFSNILQTGAMNTYTAAVSSDITIYARINGACNGATAAQSVAVDYQEPSVAITSVTPSQATTCGTENVTFTINGGTLGDGGVYEFSDISDFSNMLQSGAMNTYSAPVSADITIYARINGACNGATATQQTSVDYVKPTDLALAQEKIFDVTDPGNPVELTDGQSICQGIDVAFVYYGFDRGDNAVFSHTKNGGGAAILASSSFVGDSLYVVYENIGADIDVQFNIAGDCAPAGIPDGAISNVLDLVTFATIPAAPTVTKDKDNICANAGDVVTLTIVSPASIAFPYAYEWSSYDPQALVYDSLTSNTNQTYMVSPDSSTTYAVRIVGCNDSTAYSANLVTVKDTNVIDGATALASPSSVCQGGSSTLSLIDYTLGTNSNVVWYDNMGGTKLAQGPSFSVSNLNTVNLDTTFYVRLEGDCDTTAYKMVTIGTSFVTPVAPASVDGAPAMAVCQNTPVTLTATGPNGTQEAMSHIWEFSNDGVVYNVLSDVDNVLNLANLNAANFDVNGEATVYIRVKRTNSCDESAYSTPVTIDVQQTPGTVTSVSTDKAIYCTMELVTVTATFNHTGYNGKLEYSYDAGMNWVDTNTVMSQDLGLGVQGIMVRLNSDCGMSASVNKNVTVREAPQDVMISINTDDTVCVTEDVNLSYMSVNAGTPAGAVSYMVSTDGGITYMATGSTVDLDALALDFGGTGVATVFVKVTLSNSCGSVEDIHSFKVFNDVKIIDFSASASEFCANDLQTVTLTAVSSVNIPADYNWDLYVNGVFDQSVAGNSTTEAMFTVNPNTTTTYGVKLNGCGYETPTEVTNIITVRDTADISMATITTDADGDTIICEGSDVKFTLNLNGGSKGYNGVITWWSGTDSLGTGDTYTITVDQDTTLYAVIYSDCNISEPSVMKTIQIYSADDIHVPMMPLEVCAGADTNLNSLFTSSMMYGPDGGVFSGTGVTGGVFNGDTAGMYTINYAFEFGSGCTYSKDFMIKVYSAPEAEVVDGSIIGDACNGEGSFELTNIGEIAFVVDSVDAVVDGRTVNVGDTTLFDNLQAGVKTLYLSNSIGCNSSISVTVPQLTGLDATIDTINSKLVVCGGEDDGSLIVLATGGTAPYTYSFGGVNNGNNDTLMLDGTENLLPIVVEDNTGCQFVLNSIPFAGNSVYQSSIGNLTITNIVEPDCAEDANGRFDVIATGNDAPFMYSLDGINFQEESRFDDLVANVYFVTVMNSVGCTKEFVSTLNGPDSIDVVFNELGGNPTDGWDVEFVATGGNGGFELSLDGGATFSTDLAPTGVATGIYDFVIRDVKGCTVSGQVTVGNVGVANLNNFEASVYPNPFQDEVIVEATGIKSVKVLGLNGQLKATDMVFSNDKVRISTGDLAKGIYFIEVANDNAKVIKRVVKN